MCRPRPRFSIRHWPGSDGVASPLSLLYGAARQGFSAPAPGLASLTAALSLLIAAALVSPAWTGLPSGLTLSISGTMAAALLMTHAGAAAGRNGFSAGAGGDTMTTALCLAIALAGLIAALIALVQTFAPQWADGDWIAVPSGARAGGNLRQPNHLAHPAAAEFDCPGSGLARRHVRRPAQRWQLRPSLLDCYSSSCLPLSRTGVIGVAASRRMGSLMDRSAAAPLASLLLIAAPLMLRRCSGRLLNAWPTGGRLGRCPASIDYTWEVRDGRY